MKTIPVINEAKAKIVVRAILDDNGIPLQFPAGVATPVLEKHLENPALKRYLRPGLLVAQTGGATPKAAPKPEPKKPEPKPEPKPESAIALPSEDTKSWVMEDEKEEEDLRDFYLDAPGITEKNVEAVLKAFPTLDDLAEADEDTLIDCGVSKSFVGRVLEWAVS